MNFQFVALDLDGTLLDNQKRISPQNVETINRLQSKGVQFIFISGRHYHEIIEPLTIHGIADIHYVVSRDGQYIYRDGQIIHEGSQLSMSDIEYILQLSDARQIFCSNIEHDFIIYRSVYRFLRARVWNRKGDRTIHVPLILAKLKRYVVGKAIFFSGELKTTTIYAKMREYFTVHYVNNREYDVFPLDVNKYAALKWLSEYENISLNNLLYFGDDYNDIECFEHLPHCVVMGNAPQNLQSYSTYSNVLSNNQSGVAELLNHLYVNIN